ncbi:MAG: fructose-bisphosphatase class III, partial [Roseburia sp.]|nr:fructose-bisphosphatase class III [Roseburia sp.]
MQENDLRYLKSLAKQYPTVAQAATEIVNLQAILSLPKGTEHFITDIHGEYEQFQHILKNGSGAIKRKIDEEFGNAITVSAKKSLATLIYYPKQKMDQVLKEEENIEDWYAVTMNRLIRVCKAASSKYTRSKVRKAIPQDFSYIIEELLTGRPDVSDQEAYYNEIINSVIRTGQAKKLITAICELIRTLIVDHLHVVGDIFDRGPYPHLVMDALMEHRSVDIQWGNHDLSWMGAASGCKALICNVIRISSKYGNLSMLEDGYGINLVPLARLAMGSYAKDSCTQFKLDYREDEYDIRDAQLDEKMHKAVTIMQFKLEGQIIKEHPE